MLNFVSAVPTLPLMSSVGPLPKTKKMFSQFSECIDDSKNYNISSKVITKTP